MTTLIVGLGNPGAEYERNRHNIGFMAVDEISRQYEFNPFQKKFHGYFASGNIKQHKVLLLKPHTYMNLSGKSVLECANFFKIIPNQIVVIHDELDLETGRIKVKLGGSSAGHNGLKSIDQLVSANYQRIRVGIARPQFQPISDYVLSNFYNEELAIANHAIEVLAKNILLILSGDSAKFMNNCALELKKFTGEQDGI